jgi:hypothetical protein
MLTRVAAPPRGGDDGGGGLVERLARCDDEMASNEEAADDKVTSAAVAAAAAGEEDEDEVGATVELAEIGQHEISDDMEYREMGETVYVIIFACISSPSFHSLSWQ